MLAYEPRKLDLPAIATLCWTEVVFSSEARDPKRGVCDDRVAKPNRTRSVLPQTYRYS